MRRRRNTSDDVGVSLFPFLAVLLCTMGTLIVLLLVITDRARNTTDEPPPAAPALAETFASREDDPRIWRQRIEQLAEARGDVEAVVKDRRTRLGYLEQSTRELENKIVELKARLEEQERLAGSNAEQVAKTEEELKRLETQAAEAERNLDEIRRENTNRPTTYSIVPYEGPNTTPRRPVYIECRGRDVILQPEGIVLGEDDFLIAGDPGNPLATVLRATREYLVTGRSLRTEEEPYPLIIVRPDAVEAYYGVRQSLQGWTTDFGYELVAQDWKLSFGPADPNLAIAQNRALAEARMRQVALVAMVQRRAKKNPSYRPAARGGIVREGRDTEFGPQSIPYHGEEAGDQGGGTGAFATGRGGGGRDTESDRDGAGEGDGIGLGGGQGSDRGRSGTQSAGVGSRPPGNSQTSSPDGSYASNGTGGTVASGDPTGRGANGFHAENSPGTQSYGDPRDAQRASDASSPRPGEYGARQPDASNVANRGSPATPGGSATGSGQSSSGGESGGSPGGSPGGSAGSPSGSSFGSAAPDPTQRQESAKLDAESLANRRGRDWGLRYAAPTATPVTRPLRITCYGDRAIIASDDPRREPKQIEFKSQTSDSADDFVAAVWNEVKAWGIAGKGMYWRPVLSFDVHAGGDLRYEDLRRLLDGSGFEMRRKPTTVANRAPVGAATQRPLPPVR
ncbi:MAG: hypothetical protein WD875_04215 [Pirellulales bacterium]